MLKQIKKRATGLLIIAMVFMALPVMANTSDAETTAQVPLDTSWILAIAGILLGLYKIHTMQKSAMMSKNI